MTRCQLAPESLQQLSEQAIWPRTLYGGRVSDNGMLCQPEVGFDAELDVASIWERARVFTLTGCREALTDFSRCPSSKFIEACQIARKRSLGGHLQAIYSQDAIKRRFN